MENICFKKNRKNGFKNAKNKVFLPRMCVCLFVCCQCIYSIWRHLKVFRILPSIKDVKAGHSISNPPPREAKYIPFWISSRHKFSSAHRQINTLANDLLHILHEGFQDAQNEQSLRSIVAIQISTMRGPTTRDTDRQKIFSIRFHPPEPPRLGE